MKLPKISFSILALVAANIVPLVGVLFFGWDAAVIVLLYWSENVVIGLYNILKMALVKVESPIFRLGKLLAILFFCLHFGGFCAVHIVFLLAFFKLGGGMESSLGMEWPVICLFVSHGISFVQNYLWKKEYASLTIAKLMNQPYKRIVILHVTIIAGGVPIMILGSPVPLLCILVLLKICVDIYLHMKEHKIDTDDKVEPSNPLGFGTSDSLRCDEEN